MKKNYAYNGKENAKFILKRITIRRNKIKGKMKSDIKRDGSGEMKM